MFEDQEDLKDELEARPSGGNEAVADRPRPAPAQPPLKPPARKRGLRILGALAGLLLLGVGAYYAGYWWTQGRYLVTTDDAYVGAKNATLSPKVSGYIAEVAVEDNAEVAAGDVVARIDDGDYRLAVQNAHDQIGVQQATIDRLGRQATAQLAAVDQAKAQLASAKAGATRAQLELKRQQDLATRQINSRQALEQAEANA
ncbi:MAG TPA: biotin/lipoyl-binding protein, partial [Hyphomicrobiaceae bacterium]|nr:biotin/lipoyl-binding protein [Hyphomicrobiaceae bacterium]